MLVLPLGITFTAILQSAAAYTRSQKILGVLLSILIVAMDCVFYFAKNTYITYNCDGGLLLTFASMAILSIIYAIRSEDRATMSGNIFLAVFMLAGFLGIALGPPHVHSHFGIQPEGTGRTERPLPGLHRLLRKWRRRQGCSVQGKAERRI